ncbi:murein hydrolase activator EnvC family protein [Phycicoccus avicenniae]|uniref:murein hydrolase activator EnvC family protein n=1 Tax=Phycicoccus avicenniae TaxID=2828860 RepID=UPI003D2994B8
MDHLLPLSGLVAAAAAVAALLGAAPGPVAPPPAHAKASVTGAPVPGARAPTAVPRAGPRWRWPLSPRPEVLRPFVAPASPWGPGHRGLDLAAPPGDAVLAVEAGRVTHAGSVAGRGTVSVLHADGLTSTYEPVRASVVVGDVVRAGERLGSVDGVAAGPASHCGGCLHLGARRSPLYLDPLPLLTGSGRVRLLPLGEGR